MADDVFARAEATAQSITDRLALSAPPLIDIFIWLTEGMALYLTNGQPFDRERFSRRALPSRSDTLTKSPIHFANMGGYTFAHTFIAYLETTYGWDAVRKLIATQDCEAVFNKSEEAIYGEWVGFPQNAPESPRGWIGTFL